MSYDIGNFIGKSFDAFTKQRLLLNHWKPPKNYNFPFSEHNKIYKNKIDKRYANQKHLDRFEWLLLSDKLKGYFCKYCSFFATRGRYHKQIPLNQLVIKPQVNFSKLFGKDGILDTHVNHNYHKDAVITYSKRFSKSSWKSTK